MSTTLPHHVVVGGTGAVGSVIVDTLTHCPCRVSLYLKAKHAERLQRRRYGSIPPCIAIYDHNQRQQRRFLTACVIGGLCCFSVSVFYQKSLLITVGLSLLLAFATFVSLPHSIAPFHLVTAFDVLTTPNPLPPTTDYLWLCISSYDLRMDSSALSSLLSSLPLHAALITCTPVPSDIPFLLSLFPHPSRLLLCLPTFLAYQAPLVAEEIPATHDRSADAPQGIARYFPPFTRSLLHSTNSTLTATLSHALNTGGMPCTPTPMDPHSVLALPIALLHPLLLALELSSWSLSQLFSPAHTHTLEMMTGAMRECVGWGWVGGGVLRVVLSGGILRAALFLCMSCLPFDGEAYLVFHGTKVSDQTLMIVKELEEKGEKEGRGYGQYEENKKSS